MNINNSTKRWGFLALSIFVMTGYGATAKALTPPIFDLLELDIDNQAANPCHRVEIALLIPLSELPEFYVIYRRRGTVGEFVPVGYEERGCYLHHTDPTQVECPFTDTLLNECSVTDGIEYYYKALSVLWVDSVESEIAVVRGVSPTTNLLYFNFPLVGPWMVWNNNSTDYTRVRVFRQRLGDPIFGDQWVDIGTVEQPSNQFFFGGRAVFQGDRYRIRAERSRGVTSWGYPVRDASTFSGVVTVP